jgi:predicted O-methyltransferase YrrM
MKCVDNFSLQRSLIMKAKAPEIRGHQEFLQDTAGSSVLPDSILLKWAKETHSVSEHLLFFHGLAKGMNASSILEVGFGRSSKVFARAAVESGGVFHCCDRNDFSSLFSDTEREHLLYCPGLSSELWPALDAGKQRFDLVFLDHFSGQGVGMRFCLMEFLRAAKHLRKGGVVAVHDVADSRYPVRKLPFWVRCLGGFDSLVFPYGQGLLVAVKNGSAISWRAACIGMGLAWVEFIAKCCRRSA